MSGFAHVLGKFYFGFAYVLGKSCIFAIQINDITIMIHRLLIEDLTEWSKRKNRKPLVLRGARQVGKTTLIDEFSKQYDCYIKLNLEQSSDAKAFSISDNVAEIFQYICLQKKIVADKSKRTLLFIDEIQNEPKAVGLLRYFYEEMPWLHIVAAGSRLQTLIKQRISFPVGRVEYMSLRPCSFLEFLNATANEPLAEMIRQLNVSPIYHDMLIALFNKYTLVGGMPEALVEYATNEDVSSLSPIYRSLLNGYNEDVEKYAKNANQVNVIRHLLTHGWTEAGQTITFNRFGGSNYTSKEVHEALEVLQNAFLLSLDYPITTVNAPVAPVTTPITPAATPLAAATPVVPVAPAAPAPAPAAATPAAPAAQNTPIQDAQVPLGVNEEEDNLQNIEDEDTPLAAGGTAKDGIKTWWWWIAAAVAAITGKGVYDNRRRKPAKNDESDDESKQK